MLIINYCWAYYFLTRGYKIPGKFGKNTVADYPVVPNHL
jgi:hypothetical protein